MKYTLDELKTAVIRTYGFEHPFTIAFFEYCANELTPECYKLNTGIQLLENADWLCKEEDIFNAYVILDYLSVENFV